MTACVRRSCKSLPLNRRVQPLTKSRDWCSHALPQGQGTPCPCPCVNTRCSEYRTFAPGRICGQAGLQPLRDMGAICPTGTLAVIGSWAGVQGTIVSAAGTRRGVQSPWRAVYRALSASLLSRNLRGTNGRCTSLREYLFRRPSRPQAARTALPEYRDTMQRVKCCSRGAEGLRDKQSTSS